MSALLGKTRSGGQPRRGIAALMVLLLLSVTLALSYTMMRTQSVAIRIHDNANRRYLAQQAAMTGMNVALKKMTKSDWAGVDSTLTGTLGTYDSYKVTYTTGDPALAASSTDYSEYPYRVTLLSTGSSIDPDNPQNVATYQIRAVVRLVPRALATEPSSWTTMVGYTAYQYHNDTFEVVVPSRIEGTTYIQSWMEMSRSVWPYDDTIRCGYLDDLNLLRNGKSLDWRPFSGRITLWNWQYSDTWTRLTNLGLAYTTITWPNTYSWSPPFDTFTYRLYPGGKQYNAQIISGSYQNASFQADMLTNPLGIFFSYGSLNLVKNVSFHGTLITRNSSGCDITASGKGIQFDAQSLPALYGTTVPVQLPAVICGNDFSITDAAEVAINGQAAIVDDLIVGSAAQAKSSLTLIGQAIVGGLSITGRQEWFSKTSTWWETTYQAFQTQKPLANGIKYFPEYLQKKTDLDPTPRVIIKPATSSVRYHWQTWSSSGNSVFVADSTDKGLRWDLIRWEDCPSGT